MASTKKESEGIALLSMYNDEDDEMEDVEEQEEEEEEEEGEEEEEEDNEQQRRLEDDYGDVRISEEDSAVNNSIIFAGDSGNDTSSPVAEDNVTPEKVKFTFSSSPIQQQAMQLDNAREKKRGRLTIVDYGHDEVAMSPEAEEGEIEEGTGHVTYGEDLRAANVDFQDKATSITVRVSTLSNQATPPQYSELSQDSVNYAMLETGGANAEEVIIEEQKDPDLLDRFLPPPPKEKCSEDLQRRIIKYLDYKKAGKSFNSEVRNRKDYRNPDFLLHAVTYLDIDQIGSCFSKDVFDPHGYDRSDYYDEIEADIKREMERKEQERKKSPKIDFMARGTQPGTVASAPKINMPLPGLHPVPPPSDSVARVGRQNKKSKWDKVEGDARNPIAPMVGQDPTSAAGTHATLLAATNVGVGYMAFAQQRRREAEEKRSSERRPERRS